MNKQAYLRSFSATILCLIEFLFGVAALAALFRVIYSFGKIIGTLIKAIQVDKPDLILEQITDVVTSLTGSSAFSQWSAQLTKNITINLTIAIVLFVIVFILLILEPIFLILIGLSAFTLRFNKHGSTMIKVIHILYAMFNIFTLISVVYGAVSLLYFNKDILKDLISSTSRRSTNQTIMIAAIVITLFLCICLIIRFCYHKDVVQNMGFISADINEAPISLPKNHLSSLAVLHGLALTVLIAAYVLTTRPVSDLINHSGNLITLAILIFQALKYYLTAAANQNLKKCAQRIGIGGVGNRLH